MGVHAPSALLPGLDRGVGQKAVKEYAFTLLNAAKKHTSNGIIMAANQRGIGWRVARLFQADRSLEFALKRRKKSLSCFLPAVDVPF